MDTRESITSPGERFSRKIRSHYWHHAGVLRVCEVRPAFSGINQYCIHLVPAMTLPYHIQCRARCILEFKFHNGSHVSVNHRTSMWSTSPILGKMDQQVTDSFYLREQAWVFYSPLHLLTKDVQNKIRRQAGLYLDVLEQIIVLQHFFWSITLPIKESFLL